MEHPEGGPQQPGDIERENELRHLESIARWLDSRFEVPGTRIRFGLDSLLGLIPGFGDAATAMPAAYIILRAHRMGAPAGLIARMVANVGGDFMLGSVPLVGDVFDLGFKANTRNVTLLRQHFGSPTVLREEERTLEI